MADRVDSRRDRALPALARTTRTIRRPVAPRKLLRTRAVSPVEFIALVEEILGEEPDRGE